MKTTGWIRKAVAWDSNRNWIGWTGWAEGRRGEGVQRGLGSRGKDSLLGVGASTWGTVSSMCLLDPSFESGQRPGLRSRFALEESRSKGTAGTLPQGEMSRAWAHAPGPVPTAPKALPVPSGHPHSLCGPAALQQQLPMLCRPAGLPDLRFPALPRHAAWHCARSGYSVNTCSLIYRLERDSWTQKALPCSGPEEEQQVASTAVHGATLSRTFCLLTL